MRAAEDAIHTDAGTNAFSPERPKKDSSSIYKTFEETKCR